MPARSSNSCVRRWPSREEVVEALLRWLSAEGRRHPELLRLGYFGSYARGDWGVGSDLDLVAVITETEVPFERRSLAWRVEELQVPTELLVYTSAEWDRMEKEGGRFSATLRQETVWVWPPASPRSSAGSD